MVLVQELVSRINNRVPQCFDRWDPLLKTARKLRVFLAKKTVQIAIVN